MTRQRPVAAVPRSRDYMFPADGNVRADIASRYGFGGDLLDIYAGNTGTAAHKPHHYLPIYERYFDRGAARRCGSSRSAWPRATAFRCGAGGSGDEAVLFGIDIDPGCASLDGQAEKVCIGSQADSAFLASVVAEMGGLDLVLDDGSHQMRHIMASLQALFPRLAVGGIYMIEDLHTAYLQSYGGGYGVPGIFFNVVRNLIDYMHRWYHPQPTHFEPALSEGVAAMHVYDLSRRT